MRSLSSPRQITVLFLLILLIGAAVKLYAAQLLAWEADYVPLIARGQSWLDGGEFPAVGTLSSVAAFNMPFLVWMQLPALLFTRDVRFALVATQLLFNLFGTWIVFRLGSNVFDNRAGLVGAALFTFSDIGITSAYTAWAQLLQPTFLVTFAYCLFLWKNEARSWQVAATFIVATAAFMTHFTAVILYGFFAVFWFLLRMPIDLRGLLAGIGISALMLSPYLAFEANSDFVDLKAFFTRRTRISAEVMAEYAHLKPEAQARAAPAKPADSPEGSAAAHQPAPAARSRLERGVLWLIGIPGQVIQSLRLVFRTDLQSLRQHMPLLYAISRVLRALLEACFWFGIGHSVYFFGRSWLTTRRTLPAEQQSIRLAWALAQQQLVNLPAGRNLFLLLIVLGQVAALIIVRAGPDEQPSYYSGLISLQFLMCGYTILAIKRQYLYRRLVLLLIVVYVSLGAVDRLVRVANHDSSADSPLNLNLYENLNDAAGWIAGDWPGSESITVSYDMFPEIAHHWWIVPWNTVDDSYRVGMGLDYLLSSYYGLENLNKNPAGLADQPDYVVTSARGLERYEEEKYQLETFGALHILKPQA